MGKPLNLPFDPIERAAQRWDSEFGPSAAMKVATSIMRVHQLLLARYDALLRPYELTFARYEALVLLVFSRRGELPMRVIGERLMVHPTSVTNIVERLTRQGYVRRRRNPADGRGVLAAITPEGRTVVDRATKDLMAAGFGLEGLDTAECEQTFTILRKLRLAAADFVPPE
ncbi:MAG: MarR family winged helix-turn-helix transcriptional regulator [Micromonosporaceae bacterium]